MHAEVGHAVGGEVVGWRVVVVVVVVAVVVVVVVVAAAAAAGGGVAGGEGWGTVRHCSLCLSPEGGS